MKILCVGDVHLKGFAGNRTDEILKTQFGKLLQIAKLAKSNKVDLILQVGDLFNHPELPNEVISETIRFFFDHFGQIPFFTILGQHDKYMRSGLEKSPTRILAEAGLVTVLDQRGYEFLLGKLTWFLYGVGFGEEIPSSKWSNSILLIHKQIHPTKLFPGDEGFATPRKFLVDNPTHQLILCGDYHGRFAYCSKHRGIFNPGALTRQTIADRESFPEVLLIEITPDSLEYKQIAIACDPNPFKEQQKKQAKQSGSLQDMLVRLKQGSQSLSLDNVTKAYFEEHQVARSVQNLIWTYLEQQA